MGRVVTVVLLLLFEVVNFELIFFFRTILLIIPPVVIMDAMAGVIALIVLGYYSSIKCDPLVNKDIANTNMVRQLFLFAARWWQWSL